MDTKVLRSGTFGDKVTDNMAVVHYRVKYSWVDKEGREIPVGSRITTPGSRVEVDGRLSAVCRLPLARKAADGLRKR
jgi:hypothetical protein